VNARESFFLPDTQSLPDLRRLAIQKVGIKSLRYPIALASPGGEVQHTVADFEMTVGLPHDVKGTHMSRFVEVLERHRRPLDLAGFAGLHEAMLARLDATSGSTTARFPYFVRKAAPVSGIESLLDYEAGWVAETGSDRRTRQTVELAAPVTSLCPCSKGISDYGAHNQRSRIAIRAEVVAGNVAFEEIARAAEEAASCEVFGLLKRADEKWVTERAYDNPKFVEDLVRDVALHLSHDPRLGRFTVASENFESIHNHSAFAEIEGFGAGLPA
jgi:GTP cyclohydrolase IB